MPLCHGPGLTCLGSRGRQFPRDRPRRQPRTRPLLSPPVAWLRESQTGLPTLLTDLAATVPGAPHDQVREAAPAVAEVHGQASAHAAEDTAPQAGDEVLHTEHTVTSQPPVTTAGRMGWPSRRGAQDAWHQGPSGCGTPGEQLPRLPGWDSPGAAEGEGIRTKCSGL